MLVSEKDPIALPLREVHYSNGIFRPSLLCLKNDLFGTVRRAPCLPARYRPTVNATGAGTACLYFGESEMW